MSLNNWLSRLESESGLTGGPDSVCDCGAGPEINLVYVHYGELEPPEPTPSRCQRYGGMRPSWRVKVREMGPPLSPEDGEVREYRRQK